MVKAYQRIKNYLQVNDITENELSQRSGISEKRINSMLTGKGRISIDDMDRICKALGTDPQSILDGKPGNLVFKELTQKILKLNPRNMCLVLSFVRGLLKGEKEAVQ